MTNALTRSCIAIGLLALSGLTSGCAVIVGTADAAIGITSATVGAAAKVGGSIIDAVTPDSK